MRSSLLTACFCLALLLQPGHVKSVIDGDTFTLYTVGLVDEERVRILLVNAPERGKPLATEATTYLRTWLAVGPFSFTSCKRDSFGRMLATVSRDGKTASDGLIEAGLAVPYGK